MIIQMSKFGKMLISRPAGKEAYLAAKAYVLPKIQEEIVLDFSGVDVLAPSWGDEFVTPLKHDFPKKIKFSNTDNPSVKATLEII